MTGVRSVEVNGSESIFPMARNLTGDIIDRTPIGGITLRQYIATAALQGILAHSFNDASYQGAARDAISHADALLAALAMPAGGLTGDDDE